MRVVFLNKDDDVYAFFPDENYSLDGKIKVCYAHIGQHSPCHIDYARESMEITSEDYFDLYNELKMVYDDIDLEIVQKSDINYLIN